MFGFIIQLTTPKGPNSGHRPTLELHEVHDGNWPRASICCNQLSVPFLRTPTLMKHQAVQWSHTTVTLLKTNNKLPVSFLQPRINLVQGSSRSTAAGAARGGVITNITNFLFHSVSQLNPATLLVSRPNLGFPPPAAAAAAAAAEEDS